ncbi:hypothetical protein PIB30_035207 [Stylosanthes scabra]|uniref:RIN4 pathogenic type III effector avirulence factor Avr cleavage site domain-containing protein n=1 Tax=Stylosanthes scabra TaxID=79078 RepID=A0ABU6RD55_9FABA|nr:hypothetical protein [Stylosanthes scabra]
MATEERGRPLPKFGEWDVKNPATAEGFTVIFNIARDEKKIAKSQASENLASTQERIKSDAAHHHKAPAYTKQPQKRKWFCCG